MRGRNKSHRQPGAAISKLYRLFRRSRWAGDDFSLEPTMSAVRKTLVGLTDLSWDIARRQSEEQGFGSVSEWFEWIVLHQQFPHSEAEALFRARRKRGERGAVVVVPDDVELPPEG